MKNLIVLIISIIFSFFLCEIILRYILINDQLKLRVEANKKQFKDFQKLTWNPSTLSFIPNSEGFISHPEYKYIIRHDKFGFRNPCNINENIFVNNIIIGDSFVYGVGVQDSDTLNCKVSVSNYTIGVPNATPNCYLQLFKKNFPIIKKIIDIDRIVNLHIVFYVGNDFEDLINLERNCPNKSININEKQYSGLISSLNYIITKGFLSEFYLPQLPKLFYKNYKNKIRYKSINSSNNKYFKDNGSDTFYTNINHVNQKKLLTSLNIFDKKLKKNANEKLNIIYYLLPSGSDINEDRLIRKSKISSFDYRIIDTNIKYLSILKSCKKIRVSCVDLRKYLKGQNYFFHDTHLNASGVKILSEVIEEKAQNYN